MNKHTTDKGVSNSLRGFFERILKPYISNLFTTEATDASGRYKMDYIGTYGSLAVFKKGLPTWQQYSTSGSSSSTTGDQFIIERNKKAIFDSSASSGNSSKPFTRVAPTNAKNFSTLNSSLSDYAFPVGTYNDNSIFINPGDGSTQNVFYVSKSSNTETYDGEVLPIGSIKINSVFNFRDFNGYYFSTVEDRLENCGLYSLTTTDGTRTFALAERILDNTKLREKLVEVLETTDEELETKITSIRILDAAHCVHTGYETGNYKAYCMLLEVNKNKLVSIYSYAQTSTTAFNANTKQVDVFDIPGQIKLAQFRVDAYSGSNFKRHTSDRYPDVLFTSYLETPIVTSNNHVYRFVFDPKYKVVVKTDSAGSSWNEVGVADQAIVTFQEVNLGDFTFNGAIDIINRDAKLQVKNYGEYDFKRGNSYVATPKGLILFNTLTNSQQVTSVTISKPEILNNFIANDFVGSSTNSKIIKIYGNQGMYAGFLAITSTYSNLSWTYIYYSPDGIHWFAINNGYNRLEYTLISYSSGLAVYGSGLVSNRDLRDGNVSLTDLMNSDYSKTMEFVFYNKKEINKLNLNLNDYYSAGYSEIEAFYLIESNKVGKLMPEIKRK